MIRRSKDLLGLLLLLLLAQGTHAGLVHRLEECLGRGPVFVHEGAQHGVEDVRVHNVVATQHRQRVLDQTMRRAVEQARRFVVHPCRGDVVRRGDKDVHTHMLGFVVQGTGELVDKGLGGGVGRKERCRVVP